MARRKGEVTRRQVNRDYPHQVVIEIPPGGLGNRLDAMHGFCGTRGFEYATKGGTWEPPRETTTFSFKDPAGADAFHREFGGERRRAGLTKGGSGPK